MRLTGSVSFLCQAVPSVVGIHGGDTGMGELAYSPVIEINPGKDVTLVLLDDSGAESDVRAVVETVKNDLMLLHTPMLNGVLFTELDKVFKIRYVDVHGVVQEQCCTYKESTVHGSYHLTLLILSKSKVRYKEQRRNDFRLPHLQTVEIEYRYRDEMTLKPCVHNTVGSMYDISCGGMGVLTGLFLKIGEQLTLKFKGDVPFVIEARVVHLWERRSKVNPYRLGLKFIFPDAAVKNKLHKYVMDLQMYYLRKRSLR